MKPKDRFSIRLIYSDDETMYVTNDRSNTTALQLLVETVDLMNTLKFIEIYDNVTGELAEWSREWSK